MSCALRKKEGLAHEDLILMGRSFCRYITYPYATLAYGSVSVQGAICLRLCKWSFLRRYSHARCVQLRAVRSALSHVFVAALYDIGHGSFTRAADGIAHIDTCF